MLLILNMSIILEDSSSSSDEGYSRASTSRNSASNFTVSTHSAFQPNVPKSVAQRASSSSQNQETPTNSLRLDEMIRNNLNNESSEDNIQDRTSRITRNAQETRSQELSRRQG